MANRKPYPSDVSNEEWAFVAPYLALVREDAPQRNHDLREVFNGLRWIVRTGSAWRYMPHDLPPWEAVAIHAGERLSGWLRRGEAQERYEGTRGGGHFRTPARLTCDTSQRAGARACGRVSRDCARGHGRVGGTGIRGPRIYRREASYPRGDSWYEVGGSQARRGEAGLRALAT